MAVHKPDLVDWAAQIADLRETEYRNTLMLAALFEWLVEAGIVDREKIRQKIRELDVMAAFATSRPPEDPHRH
ncbi:MAG: hypothetical protein QJR06_04425 [Alicyclobacillaceae bacterium]|nr:hypothetical protein [Alicyclobacillaceae bacterium]